MVKFMKALGLLLLLCVNAWAQDIPTHSMPISHGPGTVGWIAGGPCNANQALVWSGTSSDPTCQTITVADISIQVGVTLVTGGNNTDILFDNAGVLGQYAISGTGNVAMTSGAALVSPTISGLTVTGSFSAAGLVTNADLANPSTTVNGVVCTLGATCAVTATATSITTGTTTVVGGTNTRILFNNAGVLGEYVITGSGNVVMSASPTLTGAPVAPTASYGTNTTQLATTAYVLARPYAEIYVSIDVPVSSGVTTTIPFDTVFVDTNSWYDPTTHRYVPQLAGKYKVTLIGQVTGTTTTIYVLDIRNQAVTTARAETEAAVTGHQSLSVSKIMSFNGSTDYTDAAVTITAAAGQSILGTAAFTRVIIEYMGP